MCSVLRFSRLHIAHQICARQVCTPYAIPSTFVRRNAHDKRAGSGGGGGGDSDNGNDEKETLVFMFMMAVIYKRRGRSY